MKHPRRLATRIVAHVLGAAATFVAFRYTTDILGWLTWQVSSLLGKSAGMHFYSLGISADSWLGEIATWALLITLPLLVIGGTAEGLERLRRRIGPAAFVLPVLIACIAGAVVGLIAGREEALLLEAWVLAVSTGLLCLLWIAIYWSVLAATLHLGRRQVIQAHTA